MRTKILMPIIMLILLASVSLAEVYQYQSEKQESTNFLASLFSLFSAAPFQQGQITGTCPNCQATCGAISKDVSTYGWGSYGNCQGFMLAKGCSTTICQGTSQGGNQPSDPSTCTPSCAGKCGITSNDCGGKCAYLECSAGSKCVNNKCINDDTSLKCTSGALKCSPDKTKQQFCDPKKGLVDIMTCPSDRECVEYSSASITCELKNNIGGSCDVLYSQKCFDKSVYVCLNTQSGKSWQKLVDCPTSLPDCVNPPSDKVAATCTKKTACAEDTRRCYPTGAIWGCKKGEEIRVVEDCQYGCDLATNTCKTAPPSECQAISSCSNYNNKDSCISNSCAVGDCAWTVETNMCKEKTEILPPTLEGACSVLDAQKCEGNTVMRCSPNGWEKMLECDTGLVCENPLDENTAATCHSPKELCTENKRDCFSNVGTIWGCKVGEAFNLIEECEFGCNEATNLCNSEKPAYCGKIEKCADYNVDQCLANECKLSDECVKIIPAPGSKEESRCGIKGEAKVYGYCANPLFNQEGFPYCVNSHTKEEYIELGLNELSASTELGQSLCDESANCMQRSEHTVPKCIKADAIGFEYSISERVYKSLGLNLLTCDVASQGFKCDDKFCVDKEEKGNLLDFFTQEAFFGIPWWGVIVGIIVILFLLYSTGKGGQK